MRLNPKDASSKCLALGWSSVWSPLKKAAMKRHKDLRPKDIIFTTGQRGFTKSCIHLPSSKLLTARSWLRKHILRVFSSNCPPIDSLHYMQISRCQWGYWSPVHTLCISTPLSSSGILSRTPLFSSRYRFGTVSFAQTSKGGGRQQNANIQSIFCHVSSGQLHQHWVYPQEARWRERSALSHPARYIHHQWKGRIHGARPFFWLPGQSLQGIRLDWLDHLHVFCCTKF